MDVSYGGPLSLPSSASLLYLRNERIATKSGEFLKMRLAIGLVERVRNGRGQPNVTGTHVEHVRAVLSVTTPLPPTRVRSARRLDGRSPFAAASQGCPKTCTRSQ